MKVEIWSDVVCPWCSIGAARFSSALQRFEGAADVDVVWRSFELDPSSGPAPAEGGGQAAMLAAKFGTGLDKAQEMLDGVTATAAADGLDFRFDLARHGNTFDAHRVLHLAREHGVQQHVKEVVDRATFGEGLRVSDHDELTAVAVRAGLEESEVREVLASDRYADDVRADEAQARAYGITGVPFFVLDGRLGVSGAQSPDVLLSALQQAWGERPALTVVGGPGADGCDDGSCAI